MRARIVLGLLLLLSVANAEAGEKTAPEKKYAPMPWHLIDTWWDLGPAVPFESLAIDVTISDDVPASVNLYIAPVGLGHLNKSAFYGGIQSQADGTTRTDPKIRKIGPGFLFSAWGERSFDAIRPADGGFCQSSGHEGDFISVRRPFAWKKGQYTYRLVRMDRETIDGKPYTWVGAFVRSHAKDENLFVGALRLPGDTLNLGGKIANFVEVYGSRRPVGDIPKVTVTFAAPVVNGMKTKPRSADAIYPKGVPDYAEAVVQDGAIVVRVGKPIENRGKRRVRLIGAE